MKIFALTLHTLYATLSQKITIGLLTAMVILLFIIIFTVHIDAGDRIINSVSIYGSKPISGDDLRFMLPQVAETYAALYFLAAIVLSVIATAQIIPEAINNRTFILYLSKPISRRSIILAVFAGVTAAITLVQLIFIAGFWIILTAKTGIWNWNLLISGVPLIVSFSALYALMVYIGIVGKSTGMVTALALAHVLLVSHLLNSQEIYVGAVLGRPVYQIIRNIIRTVLPGVHELQGMTFSIIMSGSADVTILMLSLLPCALYLWLSVRAFRRMDF